MWNVSWTAEKLQFASDAYFSGIMARQVAEAMNERFGTFYTKHSIALAMRRHFPERVAKMGAEKEQFEEAKNKEIKKLISDGWRAPAIARKTGVDLRRVQRIAGQDRAGVTRSLNLCRPWMDDEPLDRSLEGDVTEKGVHFSDLGANDCRYSIGKDEFGSYRFCASPVLPGKSYCGCHQKKCCVQAAESKETSPWWMKYEVSTIESEFDDRAPKKVLVRGGFQYV